MNRFPITNYKLRITNDFSPSLWDDASHTRSSTDPALRAYKSASARYPHGREWFAPCGDRLRSRPCASRTSAATCADWRVFRQATQRLQLSQPTARCADALDDVRECRETEAANSSFWRLCLCRFAGIAATCVAL